MLVAAACGDDDDADSTTEETESSTTAAAQEASSDVTITAQDFSFDVPAEIPAGLVDATFVNDGTVEHEGVFIKVSDDYTVEQVNTDLPSIFEGNPFPEAWEAVNGVLPTAGDTTVETTFNLDAGKYLLVCALDGDAENPDGGGQPHILRGMETVVTVTGEGGETPPTADATLTAEDYSFDVSELTAGEQTVAFVNDGPTEWHFADLSEFPEGTTEAEANAAWQAFASLEEGQPPPEGVPEPTTVISSAPASPGRGNTFDVTLESGRTYLIACFISDIAGGPPHAFAHDMYKAFTIE